MASTKLVLAITSVLMAFYVCQFSAWVYDDDEAAIIAELDDAPLEEVDLDDLFEDSSEIDARSAKDIMKNLEEKCKCEGLTCSCCGEPKVAGISFPTCVNMTMFPTDKIIEIDLGVAGNVISKNISVVKLERMCDRLPGFLKKIKICMYNTWNEATDDESMTACSSIDVLYSNTTVATVKFYCLELKDGQVSFAIPPDTGRSAIMSFKIKNPAKSLISLIKNKIKGTNKE